MQNNQFEKGDVVLAKLTGFPWWPAYIKDIKKNGKYEVFYLSDFTKSFLSKSRIRVYTDEEIKDSEDQELKTAIQNADKIIQKQTSFNQLIEQQEQLAQNQESEYESVEIEEKKPKKKKIQKPKKMKLKKTISTKKIREQENSLSEFSREIDQYFSIGKIQELEIQFQKILIQRELKVVEVMEFLDKLQRDLKDINCYELYVSKIGSYLKQLKKDLWEKNQEESKKQVCYVLIKIQEDLKKKLLKEFFTHEQRSSLNRTFSEHVLSTNDGINETQEDDQHNIEQEGNLVNKKKLEMKNELEKTQTQELETEQKEGEIFTINDRVKFRVQKKLSKVLFLNGGKKNYKKKVCENFALELEKYVREKSSDYSEYKKAVMNLIENFNQKPEDIQLFLRNFSKDKKHGLYLRRLNQILNNQIEVVIILQDSCI